MPVSLHTHSWYSLLEGTSSPEALLQRAATCGYSTLALTDTNNLYGAVPFFERADQCGVRPLLGACLRQHRFRCVALIAEPVGYRNLCRVISRLHLGRAGGVNPPVTDTGGLTPPARQEAQLLTTLLAENADGLHILLDDPVLAERLHDAFRERLWLEVVRPRIGRTGRQEEELFAWSRRLGLRPVASCAAHFASPDEYPAFRLVAAVRQGMLLEQLPEQMPITPEHHLVDPDTLRRRFRDLPEAVRNTDALAEQLRSDVLPRELVLPPARLPKNCEAEQFLRLLCERGLRRRELGDDLTARQRLRDELAVIEAGDMAGYFLVVRDIAHYARQRKHPMALRGSAGNSLVCYLLEITDVDPLRFQLPMERFLHPGRVDLPDIDLDFDWKVRDDVLAHVFRRYGQQHTAMISSHLFLKPRSAFREAAKAHGLSTEQVSQLAVSGSMWNIDRDVRSGSSGFNEDGQGEPIVLPPLETPLPPRFPLEPERWPRILADARLLLGRPQHLSVHPGGVVITPRPIEDYVPLQPAPKGVIITQFDKDGIERIGLVKIDLLGNRALATVEEATHLASGGREPPVPENRGLTPPARQVLELLQQGDTLGVGQLESPAMRSLLIQMKPETIDHVIQALALIRPAAASIGAKECFVRRRRGLEEAHYVHPCLEPVLRETYGLMLYEDDGLRVIETMTGMSAPDADRMRKRIAKHRTEEEASILAEEFIAGCVRNGIPQAAAAEQWQQLPKFNRYSFCKSHAVSYGLIAWRSAWLKAHQPLAFWTAVLNNNQGMYPRRVYVEAVKRSGIEVLLPCVNRSQGPFIVEDDAIRTGLDVIASLDEDLKQAILTERGRHGPYRDLADFRRRVAAGPEALALLIRCGALDFTGNPRPALFLEADLHDRARRAGGVNPPVPETGGLTPPARPSAVMLLDAPPELWQPSDYPTEQRRRDEWEILGFLTGPPLMSRFRSEVPAGLATSRDLPRLVGRRVRLAGLVACTQQTVTVDRRYMQFVTLDDEYGLVEVTLFPDVCPASPHLLIGPYLATGIVEKQYDVISITAQRFELAREFGEPDRPPGDRI